MGSTSNSRRTVKDLTVITQQYADRTVITAAGEVDLTTCPALQRATLIIPLRGRTLQVDLSGVTFMDSSGLNLMLRLRKRLVAQGGQIAVTGLQPLVEHMLHLTGTYELLTTAPLSKGNVRPGTAVRAEMMLEAIQDAGMTGVDTFVRVCDTVVETKDEAVADSEA
jgi:anti-sigma B factor antagonist